MYWIAPYLAFALFVLARVVFSTSPIRVSGNMLITVTGIEFLLLFTATYINPSEISIYPLPLFATLFVVLLITSRNTSYITNISSEVLSESVENSFAMLLISYKPIPLGYRISSGANTFIDIICHKIKNVAILRFSSDSQWKKGVLLRKLLAKKFDGIMPHIIIHL